MHVAYQVLGEGNPVDLVYVQGAFTHLGVDWELPAYRRLCEQLSEFVRLIWFDKRGMGLSDRVRAGTLEERMDDVRSVMDAVDSDQAVVMGVSEGGPLSMVFAAAHPERTAGLALVGAQVKERISDDWPWGEDTDKGFEEAMRQLPERWGRGGFIDYVAPSLAADPFAREWAGRLQFNAATPGAAETFMRMAFDIDVRSVAPLISAPTLIVHRTDDEVCHVENARFLARSIPGARYVELPGRDHAPWSSGDDIVAELREFITGVREAATPDRVLAAVLFTDVVGSTDRNVSLGDEKWKDLLDLHDRAVRAQLDLFRGREVKTMGDGVLAIFDGPARAIRCAKAIRGAVEGIGLKVRAGIHVGEIEHRGDDVAGVAVVLAQRVSAMARPSEILVSRTVVDLVSGSGLTFTDRGTHRLKGIPESWRVLSVDD